MKRQTCPVYLWADGTTPRAVDKLVYLCDDLVVDLSRPARAGPLHNAGWVVQAARPGSLL